MAYRASSRSYFAAPILGEASECRLKSVCLWTRSNPVFKILLWRSPPCLHLCLKFCLRDTWPHVWVAGWNELYQDIWSKQGTKLFWWLSWRTVQPYNKQTWTNCSMFALLIIWIIIESSDTTGLKHVGTSRTERQNTWFKFFFSVKCLPRMNLYSNQLHLS